MFTLVACYSMTFSATKYTIVVSVVHVHGYDTNKYSPHYPDWNRFAIVSSVQVEPWTQRCLDCPNW
jgi:hypothetical protein